MKKRLLATVLAGAMVLSMAACGSSNANKTESAAAYETANASTEAGAEGGRQIPAGSVACQSAVAYRRGHHAGASGSDQCLHGT